MATPRITVMRSQEQDIVHDQSIRSLGEIGVLIRSQSVLEMLDKSGADADPKTGIVKFPESMVSEALKMAPKRFKLCARDKKHDLTIPVGNKPPYVSTDGLTIYMRDLDTGERRDAFRKDLADFAKLADALDTVDFFWPIVTVKDVPEDAHAVHELWTSLQGCGKHVQGMCLTALDATTEIDLAALIAGGRDELKERPIFSVIHCVIAPLSFDKGLVEAQVELARAGIPVVSMSMSLSGLSSPVTFAGTIVNINTENLASLIITQFAEPGAPHIYCSESAPIDMLTGNMNYVAPEMLPISAAAGQMARRYSLPSMVGSWGIGGEGFDPNISLGMNAGNLMRAFSNTDLTIGFGGLDNALGCSLEQMVIDAREWEDFSAFLKDFNITEETAALDVVKEVGHGNTFLNHPHTAKNFKKELSIPDKNKIADWANRYSGAHSDAKNIVKKLLREHEVPGIAPDVLERGAQLIDRYEERLND